MIRKLCALQYISNNQIGRNPYLILFVIKIIFNYILYMCSKYISVKKGEDIMALTKINKQIRNYFGGSVIEQPNPKNDVNITSFYNKERELLLELKKLCNARRSLNSIEDDASANRILSICAEANKTVENIETNDEKIVELKKEINSIINVVTTELQKKQQPQAQQQEQQQKPQHTQQPQAQQQEKQQKPVRQQQAANNVGGFDISNFIKQQSPSINVNVGQNIMPKQSVFPHQIDGLTDEQMIAEVGNHYKFLSNAQVELYPMYDLIKNRYLKKKMTELDAKQRPNNPFLTQVNITEYIAEPDLLNKYQMCFTIPCNDKRQVIMVLFSPVAVPGNNGALQYPLHIFKATKTKKQ